MDCWGGLPQSGMIDHLLHNTHVNALQVSTAMHCRVIAVCFRVEMLSCRYGLVIKYLVGIRVGHAYAEYANDADYAHMRNMRMRMRIENLIHIIHI